MQQNGPLQREMEVENCSGLSGTINRPYSMTVDVNVVNTY